MSEPLHFSLVSQTNLDDLTAATLRWPLASRLLYIIFNTFQYYSRYYLAKQCLEGIVCRE
jgi:hypothetical protein